MPQRTNAYQDQTGRPWLRPSTVAVFDIPTFSDAWTQSAAAGVGEQHLIDTIVTAIEESGDFVRQSYPDREVAKAGHWEVKLFNENLVFGNPIERNDTNPASAWPIVCCVQRYQLQMALNGYYLRGALLQGPICLTDEIIFGSALDEYYQLKSKASNVPRVVLTEPVRQLAHKMASIDTEQTWPDARDTIYRDLDGWWFLNYLDSAREGSAINWTLIERHKESILKFLSSVTRRDILLNFEWACRYHNVFCHSKRDSPGYLDRYCIASADEESTIVRLSDSAS